MSRASVRASWCRTTTATSRRGIKALAAAMGELGEVWVVAPETEQSASSHAISIHRPLRMREVRPRWYAVDGTPTDCSWLGIHHVMREAAARAHGLGHQPRAEPRGRRDLLGHDRRGDGGVDHRRAGDRLQPGGPGRASTSRPRRASRARWSRRRSRSELPTNLLLNVNVPPGVEPDGYVVTRLGKHSYGSDVVEKKDPRGRPYYWIGGNEYQHEDIPGSDCNVGAAREARLGDAADARPHRREEPPARRVLDARGLPAVLNRSAPPGEDRGGPRRQREAQAPARDRDRLHPAQAILERLALAEAEADDWRSPASRPRPRC